MVRSASEFLSSLLLLLSRLSASREKHVSTCPIPDRSSFNPSFSFPSFPFRFSSSSPVSPSPLLPFSLPPDSALPLQNTSSTFTLLILPDLISLPHLHEPGILFNLLSRHALSQPYTSCGEIVLAMNPYRWLPELYSPEVMSAVNQAVIFSKADATSAADKQPPHCYQTSARAYSDLLGEGKNQSILVSGESGAGKVSLFSLSDWAVVS